MAAKKPASKTKPLAGMKNTGKGKIDHVRIYPAKNADGEQAFITHIHRHHPAAVEGTDRDAKGNYLPSPEPEQTVHDDGNDMLDHVANTYGIKPDNDADEGEDEDEGNEAE